MGKIIKKRIEYGGSSNSAENIKYDDTKNVKEAINDVGNLLGNTDISAIGDGTVTGGLNALNSNLIEIQTVSGTLNTDDSWLNVSLPSGFTSQNSVVVGIKVFWYSDLYISTQYLSGKEKYECYYSSLNSFSIRGLDSDTQGKTFYVSFMKLKN